MKRHQRLRSSADFARVRGSGRSLVQPLLVLTVLANELDHSRVGVTVSRRVGTAVVRNRIRRRLSEALRTRYADLPLGQDLVLVARPAAAGASWAELNQALDRALARATAFTPGTAAPAAASDHVE